MEKQKCFWCEKEFEKIQLFKCECGRMVCDNCDDDGSCHEGNCCPYSIAMMIWWSLVNQTYYDFYTNVYDKNYNFIKRVFEYVNILFQNHPTKYGYFANDNKVNMKAIKDFI